MTAVTPLVPRQEIKWLAAVAVVQAQSALMLLLIQAATVETAWLTLSRVHP
jgi:hypothetical protein